MGSQKLLLPWGRTTVLQSVMHNCAAYRVVVVASPAVAATFEGGVEVVENAAPERGMAHSLRLASAVIEPGASLAVMLGDKPLVDAAAIDRVVSGRGSADVAYPVRQGDVGHPVVLGPAARLLLASLPDGDVLRDLRDDPRLVRRAIDIDEDGPYTDIDTPEQYAALRAAGADRHQL